MGRKVSRQFRPYGLLILTGLFLLVSIPWLRWSQNQPNHISCIQTCTEQDPKSLLNIPGVKEHNRLRLARLALAKADVWMATPDWEDKRHPHYGAEWYEQAWKTSRFNYDEKVCGQLCVERILEVVPCSKGSLMFQAGAHLGVFPFMGMALGCSGLSVEGNPIHIPFMQLNARLNGFQNHFTVVNAIVGEKDDAQGLSFAGQSIAEHSTPGAVTVPMVKLDTVFKAFSEDMQVSLGIVDTEGYENNVLQGAVQLIKSRRVAVWVIEVWYRQHGRNVSALPGLQLLLNNGYKLFDTDINQIGVSSADIDKMLRTYCATPGWRSGADGCLMDHVAVQDELADKVVAALRN